MGRSISTDTPNQQPSLHLLNRPRSLPPTLPSTTTIVPLIHTLVLALVKKIILSTQKTLTLDFIVRAAKETRIRAADRCFTTAGSSGTESVALGRAGVEGAAAAEIFWVMDFAHL